MFTHAIDPVITTVGGVHLWWYGTGFTLGFWQMHRYVRTHRRSLGLSPRQVYTLSLYLVVGVLVVGVLAGGRLVEVLFDEWAFYSAYPSFVPRYWLGGGGNPWVTHRCGVGHGPVRLVGASAVP